MSRKTVNSFQQSRVRLYEDTIVTKKASKVRAESSDILTVPV